MNKDVTINSKMKIGIISINMYSKYLNFACPLHTFAFQQFLLKNGFDVTVIDYKPIYFNNFDMIHPFNYYKKSIKQLKKENPELAQALEVILTSKGTKSGYGRPGTSGVMVAMPSSDGVTLKCPNNNVYAATPYALVSGAAPESIKRVSQKTAVRKWHSLVGKMQEELQKILNGV